MKLNRELGLLCAVAAIAAAAILASVSHAASLPCTEGYPLVAGKVEIGFPNSTTAQATITVVPSFCGETVTGYTTTWGDSFTTSVSPGQQISITVYPCLSLEGCQPYNGFSATQTAPTGGGSGGGGGSVTQCNDGQDNDGNGAIDANDSGCSSPSDNLEAGGHAINAPPPPPAPPVNNDRDGDGVANAVDNCPDKPNPLGGNPGQRDSDGNGVGDACQTIFYPMDSARSDNGMAISDIRDSCFADRTGATRCLAGATARNEKCGKFSDGLYVTELGTGRTLMHQRYYRQACWIPGVGFTRAIPCDSNGCTQDLTNTLYTYPWVTSVKSGPSITISGRNLELYVQFDSVQRPIFLSFAEGFHKYPWARSNWYLPSTAAYPPTFIGFTSGV